MIISMIVSFTVTFTMLQAKVSAMEDKGVKLRTEFETFQAERVEALNKLDNKIDILIVRQAEIQKDVEFIKIQVK